MPIAPGTRIGPYEVVGWLGAGGMGEVYRARDPRFARDVAIKLISETVATDRTRVHRFEQEARAVGQLNHPNILAVYDIGTHEGAPYIVSELLEGETLRDRLKRGPLSSSKAVAAARQIAEGLAAAHDKGIVHRDLKPDNLFITSDGRIKILDFGIAKLTRPGDDTARETGFPTDTTPGMVIGTVGYMSPEQVRGAAVDHRSDLFSFGTILYEVLTGRQAFTRQTGADSMSAILNEDPTESLGASVSPGLARIVSRCLEKSREARFQSARDLAFALEVLSGTAGAPAVGVPRPRRWGMTLGLGLALGVLVVIAVVVGWLKTRDTTLSFESRLANATFTAITNSEASELEAVISPNGAFIAYLSDRDGPYHVFLSQVDVGNPQPFTPGLPDQRNAGLNITVGFTGDGSKLWFAGTRAKQMVLMPLLPGASHAFLPEKAVNIAWSRDGKRLVYFTYEQGDPLYVADSNAGDGRQIFIDEKGDHNHFPAWSKDDEWVYFTNGIHGTSEYDIWRIRPEGGEPERLTHHNADVRYVTPIDARTVLYVAPDEDGSGPWLWALDTVRKKHSRVSVGLERYLSISATGDGLRLVATVATSPPTAGLWRVPIHDGRLADEREVTSYKEVSAVRAWAPRFENGSLFYLSSSGGGDGLWRYRDGKAGEIRRGSAGPLREPAAVSPGANQVAVVGRKGQKRHLAIMSADGSGYHSLTEEIDVRGTSAWTPDEKWIVTGGNDARGPGLFMIPIDGGTPVRLVSGQAYDPAVSPKADLIVYSGQQQANAPLFAVRRDGTKVELPKINVPFGGGGRARFLPDGRLVYFKGQIGRYDFWVLDFTTGTSQQLTQFSNPATIYAFDIGPDAKYIVFDRIRENSDIRMIDLKKE